MDIRLSIVVVMACSPSPKPTDAPPPPTAQPEQLPSVAVATSATPPDDPGNCEHDTDCVVSDFGGCCGGCGARPFATSKKDLETWQAACAAASCAAPTGVCPHVEPTSHFTTTCQGLTQAHRGRCTLVARPAAPVAAALCHQDSDCTVSNRGGCCDPCQVAPYAVLKGHENGIACVTDCSLNPHPPCAAVESASLYRATCGGDGACKLVRR